MEFLKVYRITLINAHFGNNLDTCTRMEITKSKIIFYNKNKDAFHYHYWSQLKSMLFVEDRVHIKFGVKEPFTLWCQFTSLYHSQNCQAELLKARIVKQSNRIGTFDRLRFKMPLKYVSLASEEQPRTASYQSNKERNGKRTQSVLSGDSHVYPEFIKQIVPLVTGPIQPIDTENITPLDLDNLMCYCIFGYSLPEDYFSVASKAFAAKYGV